MYSDKVMEIFKNPKNIGELENADCVGTVGNPVCGDVMKIFIKIENNIITDVKVKTFGCVAAIVTSSAFTEMVKGKTIDYAMKLTKQDIVNWLGGLPTEKIHCSVLAVDALHKAIENYRGRKHV